MAASKTHGCSLPDSSSPYALPTLAAALAAAAALAPALALAAPLALALARPAVVALPATPPPSQVLYVLLLVLISTAVMQIRFLNLAMEHFGNTETVHQPPRHAPCPPCAPLAHSMHTARTHLTHLTPRLTHSIPPLHAPTPTRPHAQVPVYYVIFTVAVITISNILYKDFQYEDRRNVACFAVGCLLTFLGVKLLTSRRPRAATKVSAHLTPTPALTLSTNHARALSRTLSRALTRALSRALTSTPIPTPPSR